MSYQDDHVEPVKRNSILQALGMGKKDKLIHESSPTTGTTLLTLIQSVKSILNLLT
jgi:hypothetical protein